MARETYIVDTPWPEEPVLFGSEIERLREWIRAPESRAAALTGGAGVGKTSLVGRLLLGEAERFEGVKRIGCWPGIQPEEIAVELADFLMHLGYGRPGAALEQRLPIASKLRILAGSLSLANAIVWIDDFDLAVPEEAEGSSGEVRRILLDALVEAAAGKTRFIFTGTETIPGFRALWGSGALELALEGLQPSEGDALFRSLGDSPSLRWELLPASLRHLPLAVVLLGRIGARIGPSAVLGMEDPGPENLLAVLDRVWGELPLATRRLLGGLALVDEPIPAGLMRTFLEPAGMGGALGPALDWDLVRPGAPLSNRYFVHRLVRGFARSRLERDDPAEVDACLGRAGMYFERLAQASRTVWDRLRARRYFYRAGRHEKAYDLQKDVLEDLLRKGYLDLARQILDETARTTRGQHRAVALGNLAIIHKNQGDYDKALELYREVHREFESLGDRPNLARVLHQLGNTYYLKGALDDAVEHYEACRKLAREVGERGVAAASQVQIGNIHYLRGDLESALAEYQASLRAAREVGDTDMAIAVLLQIGQIRFLRRQLIEARESLEEAEALAQGAGDVANQVKVLQLLGLVAQARQAFDEGIERLRLAIELARRLGDGEEYALGLAHMAGLELDRGKFGSAVRHLADAAAASEPPSEIHEALRKIAAELARRVGPEAFRELAARAGAPDLPDRLADPNAA